MPIIVETDCTLCSKKNEGCCKACFNTRDTNIFEHLTDSELNALMSKEQEVIYEPGEIIMNQNLPSTYAVCIKSGYAKIYVEGIDKKRIIVKIISGHDFIAGGDVFDGNIQQFTITAATKVKCCLIDSSKLTKLFSQNNQFAIDLLRHHTKQSNYLLAKLVNLTQKYMPGRVADTLLYLESEVFLTNPFPIPFTRQELAEMSNMTKESFIRILQEFKNSQVIKTEGNTIEIIDKNSLISISKNG